MDGILIVNKPKEFTSHDVVAKVKKICGVKVGHTGTLDPMATGVLPLLLGEGTKLSKYLINHDKIYNVTLKLGEQTETADSEGKIIQKKEVNQKNLEKNNVQKIFKTLIGKQMQTPPMYSAIKVNGKKLYEYARQGKTVDVKQRQIEIYKLELIQIKQNTICFNVHCSKGTYIRSLCETIAQKLETVGYMQNLNRIQVGNFNIKQAINIKEIMENTPIEKNIEFWKTQLISIQKFFEEYPIITLEKNKIHLFLNGVKLTKIVSNGIYQIKTQDGLWIGTGIIENNLLKRDIVILKNYT